MHKKVLIFIGFLVFSAASQAQDSGATGFDFLLTELGGRPSAMGGAFFSVPEDVLGAWYNPASLSGTGDWETTVTYLDHLLDLRSGYLSLNKRLGTAGQVGLGVFYMNYGELHRTDIIGGDLGTFHPGDCVISGMYARHVWAGLSAGVTFKYFYSIIDEYSAGGIAGDIGLLYSVPQWSASFGFSMRNAGIVLNRYLDASESLPLSFHLGSSKKLAHLPLLLSGAVSVYPGLARSETAGWFFMGGGEFTITRYFFLRLGYNSRGSGQKLGADNDWLAGFSMGLGFLWKRFQLDYGFASYGALGFAHHFTFTFAVSSE